MDALTVRSDRFTTSWVLTYKAPDGVHGLSAVAASQMTDQLAAKIAPGLDSAGLLAQWRTDLAKPSASDHLTSRALANAQIRGGVDLGLDPGADAD